MIRYCPICKSDQRGDPIPEENRQYYSPPYYYWRTIGIYDIDRDRTVEWQCPDCSSRWDREEE